MPPLIELRNVSRQFGSQHILRNLTIQVAKGETLVIIGESGCGKSVTLKLMINLLKPTSGEVFWQGDAVAAMPEHEVVQRRLKIGYLFQMAALFDSLSIYENVAFGLRQNRRLPEADVKNIVADRLRDVGLNIDVVGAKFPSQLSGGMRKRVGLARALALDPEIMLYDEPTTGLDPIMSDVINELILRTRDRANMTSIVVTHDMHTVRKVADRIVMLYPLARLDPQEPQIVFEGTAEEAFAHTEPRVSQFVNGEAGDRLLELSGA